MNSLRHVFASCIGVVAGSALLGAAILKEQAGPIEGWGIRMHLFLLEAEVFLAIVLLSRVKPSIINPLATVCFGAFFLYSLRKAIGGAASCGCFGRVEVNPWVTASMDFVLMVLLAWSAVVNWKLPPKPTSWRTVAGVFGLWTCLSIVVFWSTFWRTPAAFADANQKADVAALGTVSGNLIVLEPEHWAGKPFALADFIPHEEALKTGRWVVLIYHNGCSTCQQALPAFKSATDWGTGANPKIALIEIPPHEEGVLGGWGDLNAALPDTYDWFATTPVAIAVENNIVKAAVSGEAVIDAAGFLRKAGFEGGKEVDGR